VSRDVLDESIARFAKKNALPESAVRRVVADIKSANPDIAAATLAELVDGMSVHKPLSKDEVTELATQMRRCAGGRP